MSAGDGASAVLKSVTINCESGEQPVSWLAMCAGQRILQQNAHGSRRHREAHKFGSGILLPRALKKNNKVIHPKVKVNTVFKDGDSASLTVHATFDERWRRQLRIEDNGRSPLASAFTSLAFQHSKEQRQNEAVASNVSGFSMSLVANSAKDKGVFIGGETRTGEEHKIFVNKAAKGFFKKTAQKRLTRLDHQSREAQIRHRLHTQTHDGAKNFAKRSAKEKQKTVELMKQHDFDKIWTVLSKLLDWEQWEQCKAVFTQHLSVLDEVFQFYSGSVFAGTAFFGECPASTLTIEEFMQCIKRCQLTFKSTISTRTVRSPSSGEAQGAPSLTGLPVVGRNKAAMKSNGMADFDDACDKVVARLAVEWGDTIRSVGMQRYQFMEALIRLIPFVPSLDFSSSTIGGALEVLLSEFIVPNMKAVLPHHTTDPLRQALHETGVLKLLAEHTSTLLLPVYRLYAVSNEKEPPKHASPRSAATSELSVGESAVKPRPTMDYVEFKMVVEDCGLVRRNVKNGGGGAGTGSPRKQSVAGRVKLLPEGQTLHEVDLRGAFVGAQADVAGLLLEMPEKRKGAVRRRTQRNNTGDSNGNGVSRGGGSNGDSSGGGSGGSNGDSSGGGSGGSNGDSSGGGAASRKLNARQNEAVLGSEMIFSEFVEGIARVGVLKYGTAAQRQQWRVRGTVPMTPARGARDEKVGEIRPVEERTFTEILRLVLEALGALRVLGMSSASPPKQAQAAVEKCQSQTQGAPESDRHLGAAHNSPHPPLQPPNPRRYRAGYRRPIRPHTSEIAKSREVRVDRGQAGEQKRRSIGVPHTSPSPSRIRARAGATALRPVIFELSETNGRHVFS
jgi:hypothetical protein